MKSKFSSVICEVLLFITLLVLCVSCKRTYDNTIVSRDIDTQATTWVYDSTTNANVQKFDSVYIVKVTWGQAWHKGKTDGSVIWFFVSLVICLAALLYAAYLSNNQKSPGDYRMLYVIGIALIAFGGMGAAFEWDKWNSDKPIKKTLYEQLINTDGDLHQFWEPYGY